MSEPMSAIIIPNQRAVIDRRDLAEAVALAVADRGVHKARPKVVGLLKGALEKGREELARRLAEQPSAGYQCVYGHSFLMDQLIRVLHDHVIADVFPAPNPTAAQRLTLIAVGGYGRGEMAPHSDVDIAFITPAKSTPWCEQVIEAMLYYLWDLGLKVGHSSRSLDEMVRMAKHDLTIRTAILEGRYLWGDQAQYDEASRRFWSDVVPGSEAQFVAEKLDERNQRHVRMGDSRYVVEPNVKDGKGGLRDLQTLYWIGKYIHRVKSSAELVDVGLLTAQEYRTFRRAENFLLAVRCHLHMTTNRAEDRLTFDLQREVAARMQFADRTGKRAVERFMQYYFLQARHVGHLTGVFLTHIDEEMAGKKKARGLLATFRPRPRELKGYKVFGGKIAAPADDWFEKDPVRLIEIFQLAEEHGYEIHPETLRMIARDVKAIDAHVRADPRANVTSGGTVS